MQYIGRKETLGASLLEKYQLPVELRYIIIENYFPFLPNENNMSFLFSLQGQGIHLSPSLYASLSIIHSGVSPYVIVKPQIKRILNEYPCNYKCPYHGGCLDRSNMFIFEFNRCIAKNDRIYDKNHAELIEWRQSSLVWYRNVVLNFFEKMEANKCCL